MCQIFGIILVQCLNYFINSIPPKIIIVISFIRSAFLDRMTAMFHKSRFLSSHFSALLGRLTDNQHSDEVRAYRCNV